MNIKLLFVALILSFNLHSVFSQTEDESVQAIDSHINFVQGTYDDAVQKAKDEKKPLFVDAFATWCGPCKWMSSTVFTDLQVSQYFNKNFVNYQYDMEKGEGPAFAIQYNVKGYPSLFFIDPNTGNALQNYLGALSASALLDLAKKGMSKFITQ